MTRILFVVRHGGYVRNFEWVSRLLAERSHHVQLGVAPPEWQSGFDVGVRTHPARQASRGDRARSTSAVLERISAREADKTRARLRRARRPGLYDRSPAGR
jgi:hypothetical protein